MSAPVLAYEGLGLVQGAGWLFRDLDIFIGERDRLALIGRNGAGKTTLLKLLAGAFDADAGRRTIRPGTNVVLLEQDPKVDGFETLRDFVLGGDNAPPVHAAEAIADQLGIDLGRPAAGASGGERRRAAIVRALALEPDVLLLDEPTNHLDLAAIEWLESWLKRFRGAFVVISHDRTFLTRLTGSTLWLDRGRIRRAEVGYGGFEAWAEQVQEEDARNAQRLDTKLAQELHWLQRGVTARRRRNQGRLARLHDMRAQRRGMIEGAGTAKLSLAQDATRSKDVIEAKDVSRSFGDRVVLKDFSLKIQRGDRIGIVGANGSGKSTLLKLLTGEIEPDSGTIRRAKTLDGIVIDQQRSLLKPGTTVRDILADGGDWVTVKGEKKHIVGYLKDFLFDAGTVDTPVDVLSGGERSRLVLAREFARESNLLVLDEPTNDLDMETLDLLQEVISDYPGTVLLVSHDRDFLDRTVTLTVGLDGSGRAEIVAGGYADWEARRKARLEQQRPAAAKGDARPQAQAKPARKLSYKDQRDLDRLPGEIEALEAAIARDEAALSDPEIYTRDPARFAALTAAIDAARASKEAAELRWLEVAEMAEALGD
jgi:ATP-binding cassette subfamily F protein uup